MSAEAPTPRTSPPRRPLPSALNVITGALGLFLVVLTLLALQVRSGKDPSLSPGASGSSTTGAPTSRSAPAATRKVVTKTS
ncbi:MAG: hypothetical protein ACXVVK_06020 [Solirubrobacteraceae bacterium]